METQLDKEIGVDPPQRGSALIFRNLSYEVPAKGGGKKRILDNITGGAKPGEVLFVMGASGAGKSTLLDTLAGLVKGQHGGDILVEGQKLEEEKFKQISKYVRQEDMLYEALTVKETLTYSARFHSNLDRDSLRQNVENAIALLGLQNQADVKIGGTFFRGLSGGQKRRVSIGEQLVLQPSILFLDEPTSGLDSAAAYAIIASIRQVARKTNIAIICTIHQPGERVFNLADRLLLLGNDHNGGRVVFFGPPSEIETHFANHQVLKPDGAYLHEWILDLVSRDFSNDPELHAKALAAWPGSEGEMNANKWLDAFADSDAVALRTWIGIQFNANSMWRKYLVIVERSLLNLVRNPAVIWLRLLMYLMMAAMVGTVFLHVGEDTQVATVQDLAGGLFFIVAFFAFMSISALPAFLEDKHVFVKERATGCYNVATYSLASFTASLPSVFMLAVGSALVCFFSMGLDGSDGKFFMWVLNLFLNCLVAESICVLASVVVPFFIVALALSASVFGLFMIVCGFWIKLQNIPAGWRWVHHIAFHYYAHGNAMYLQLHDANILRSPDAIPPSLTDIPGDSILEAYGYGDVSFWENIGYLILMIFVFRCLTAFVTWKFHTGKK